jgi:hypothetical protein
MTIHHRIATASAPLTEAELRAIAPSIFAETAHPDRSERFRPIATIDVLRALSVEGFHPVAAMATRSRTEDRRAFGKHLVRLRREGEPVRPQQVGEAVFGEVILRNANDGTGLWELLAGMFRLVCGNGLIVGETVAAARVRHAGNPDAVIAAVIEGTHKTLEFARIATAAPAEWSAIELSPVDRYELAEAAHGFRFADADGHVETPITVEQMLVPRRPEDDKPDLWSIFNIVQENATRGGLTNTRTRRQVTTRSLRNIDETVRINRNIWDHAAHMAKALTAAE